MCADADVVPGYSTGDHSVPSAASSYPVIESALRRDALHSIFGDGYESLLEDSSEDDEEVGKSAPASPCADKVITLLITVSSIFFDPHLVQS